RSRFAETAKNSRNRWAAPLSNLPCAAIHSAQPRPQAFGSPVATAKIIGSFWTFASKRSSSLGSSFAAIATIGRQQSATVIHRINLRIITLLRAENRREILLCLHRPLDATGSAGDLDPRVRGGGDPPIPEAHARSHRAGMERATRRPFQPGPAPQAASEAA